MYENFWTIVYPELYGQLYFFILLNDFLGRFGRSKVKFTNLNTLSCSIYQF